MALHRPEAGMSGAGVPATSAAVPALALCDVRKGYRQADIINGCTLRVMPGQRCAIIGPNGAGKSTLLNLISGRDRCDSGSIALNGGDIVGLKPYQIHRRGLSRSFQISSLFHNLSAFENLRCALLWPLGYRYAFWRRLSGLRDANARAQALLQQLGLLHCADTPAGQLAYAQQRALELGISIAGGAEVILLDEPTAGMSRSESAAMVALIRSVTQGKTLLMIEHDMDVVFELADIVAVMVDGRVIACDSAARIRDDPQVRQLYLKRDGDARGDAGTAS
jgi:branched-chain amino acid transport system ATP-binding protein